MIRELEPGQYERVRPVFDGLRYNLVVDSVIDGNTPAWVYADAVHNPTAAFMWNRQDALLVAGASDNEAFNRGLAALIAEEVIPDARRRFIPYLSLHYHPATWESEVSVILRGQAPEQAERRLYLLDQLKFDWRERVPAGYEIRRLDEELLTRTDLQHVRRVADWVRSFWSSISDFTDTGFGFGLLQDDVVVSWCFSVYVSGEDYELGVATVPAHQGRGFATLTAAACVEHCVTHGLTPHWHCWDDNRPSIAVAEKVGFELVRKYAVYRFAV